MYKITIKRLYTYRINYMFFFKLSTLCSKQQHGNFNLFRYDQMEPVSISFSHEKGAFDRGMRCNVKSSLSKKKTKEPPRFLSPSGIREGKFISV